MAFEKCMTIQELFLKAILKTYRQLVMKGQLKPVKADVQKDHLYTQMIAGQKTFSDVVE